MHSLNLMLQNPSGIDKIAAILVNVARLDPASSKSTAQLVSMLNEFRCILRLPGLYKLIVNFRKDSSPETYMSNAINIGYYVTEGLAFLGGKQIISISKPLEDKLWLWSSRFWLLDTLLTIYQLLREKTEDEKEHQLDLASNLASLPLCIHWSVENGAGLHKHQIGVLGLFSAIVQTRKLILSLHNKRA